MKADKVTLNSVAEKLQLSRQSVSRAVSGKPGVSEETRRMVIDTLQELGYRHPRLAPPHRDSTKESILLLVAHHDVTHSEFWMEIVRGAEEEATRLGFNLVTRPFLSSSNGQDDRQSWEHFRGVIVAGRRAREAMKLYLEPDMPATLITYPKPMEEYDTVVVADWEGGMAVGQHLLALGHKHIAFITDIPEEMSRTERARGLRDAAKGKDAHVEELTLAMEHPQEDFERLYLFYVKQGNAPTAFFCATDNVAIVVLLVLQQLGLKIPADVSVVGYNDSENASLLKLTTLRPPLRKIGASAMQNLHRQMTQDSNTAQPPQRLFLVPELIVRNTTDSAPK